MSTLVLDRIEARLEGTDTMPSLIAPRTDPSGGLTLDQLITGVWEGLTAEESVRCPACGGTMVPRYSAGATPVGGICHRCHSEMA